MLEASTALSSPQQSLYRHRFTSLYVLLLLARSLVLCIPPYEADSEPATVLTLSVQQSYTLTS